MKVGKDLNDSKMSEDQVYISYDHELINSSQMSENIEPLFGDVNLNAAEAEFQPQNNVLLLFDRLKAIPGADRSAEFKGLQDAITKNEDIIRGIAEGRINFAGENYRHFMNIYQAVCAYMTTHVNSSDEKSITAYNIAGTMRKMLDKAASSRLDGVKISNVEDLHCLPKEIKYAAENVERLMKYYRKYSMRVDQDLLASDEEKLIRKWDALKSCERDIEIYLAGKLERAHRRGEKLKGADAFLYHEYHSLKTQVLIRNRLQGEKEDSNTNKDEGLDEKQIAAISRIDTWIIRNFRNGGYMAVFGEVSDRTDIIGRLMALSRRKRLYIYYLIESKERLKPTAQGLVQSQLSYTPNLDGFKDKMIANRLKFYKRFSGGYIYWNKLTEAMGIASQAQPMFSKMDLLLQEKARKKEEEANDNNIIPENEKRRELMDILRLSLKAIRLAQENNDKKTGKDKKEANNREMAGLSKQIAQILGKQKAKESSVKEDVKMVTQKIPSNAASVALVAKNTLSEPYIQKWFDYTGKELENYSKYYDKVINGVSLFSSIAGSIFTLLSLKKDSKSMNWLEFTSVSVGLGGSVYKSARTTATIVQSAGAETAVTKALTSNTAVFVSAGVDTTVAVMNTASYWKGSKNRIKASKLAGKLGRKGLKETNEDRFREGMLELNRRLGKRQKKNTLGSLGSAVLSSTALVLTTLSVVTAGVSAIAGAIALGIQTGLAVSDVDYAKSMKEALFDSFYKTDEVYSLEEAKWKENNPGKQLTDKQKIKMRKLIRNRIAANEGFYSPGHASKAVAAEFAKFLLYKANAFNEEAPMYVAMIKGLGLTYSFDPLNEEKNVPKESDIVKKLCS